MDGSLKRISPEEVISPACGARFPRATPQPSQKPDGTLVEPWWNCGGTLVEPYLRATPDHPGAWAETPKLSAVGEQKVEALLTC